MPITISREHALSYGFHYQSQKAVDKPGTFLIQFLSGFIEADIIIFAGNSV